jgi:ParB family chromosome partitioning protein
VSNLLRLLDLDEEIQALLREKKLEMGHARALLSLPLPLQREAARQVLMHGLSVRETEALVRRLQQEPAESPLSTPLDPNIRVLQSDLSTRLGAKVLVKHTASGRGRLVIHYNSLDELDGILNRVK